MSGRAVTGFPSSKSRRSRLNGRRLWAKTHLWIALSVGWVMAVMGISGSILIYKDELERLFLPPIQRQSDSAPLADVNKVMAAAYYLFSKDSGSWSLTFPQGEGAPYRVTYLNNDLTVDVMEPVEIWIDPYRAKLLRLTQAKDRWLDDWLYRLHSTLQLGDGGRLWVAAAGGLFAVSVTSGLYLWWPGRLAGFRWKMTSLHHWLGMISAPVLLLSIVTGLYLALPQYLVPWLHEADKTAAWAPGQNYFTGTQSPLPVEDVMASALAAFPGARLRRLSFPEAPEDPYIVALYWPGYADTPKGWVKVAVDAYLGKVISYHLPPDQGIRAWLEQWIYLLHNGSAMGPGGRALLCLGGLAPGVLMTTGTLTWWRRHRRRKKRRFELLPG